MTGGGAQTALSAKPRERRLWSPKGAIEVEGAAIVFAVGVGVMIGRGVGVAAGMTTAVGLGGTLAVAPGQATMTAITTTIAAATPARAPKTMFIRATMP